MSVSRFDQGRRPPQQRRLSRRRETGRTVVVPARSPTLVLVTGFGPSGILPMVSA